MCLEYNKLMELGVFILMEDLKISKGKYSFRNINKDRYYDIHHKFLSHIGPTEEENISHIQCDINILKAPREYLLSEEKQNELNKKGSCEVFLTKSDIPKIRLLEVLKFNPVIISSANDLYQYMKDTNYPFDLDKYKTDHILIYREVPI